MYDTLCNQDALELGSSGEPKGRACRDATLLVEELELLRLA